MYSYIEPVCLSIVSLVHIFWKHWLSTELSPSHDNSGIICCKNLNQCIALPSIQMKVIWIFSAGLMCHTRNFSALAIQPRDLVLRNWEVPPSFPMIDTPHFCHSCCCSFLVRQHADAWVEGPHHLWVASQHHYRSNLHLASAPSMQEAVWCHLSWSHSWFPGNENCVCWPPSWEIPLMSPNFDSWLHTCRQRIWQVRPFCCEPTVKNWRNRMEDRKNKNKSVISEWNVNIHGENSTPRVSPFSHKLCNFLKFISLSLFPLFI